MDREAWWATVHRVAKSQIQLKLLSKHAHNSILNNALNMKYSITFLPFSLHIYSKIFMNIINSLHICFLITCSMLFMQNIVYMLLFMCY